jgi:hypothetical protein
MDVGEKSSHQALSFVSHSQEYVNCISPLYVPFYWAIGFP